MAFMTIPLKNFGYHISGMVSNKPKLGQGKGNSHSYCNHFKENGYVGYANMAHTLFRYILYQANERDIALHTNILYMRESKANWREDRNYYMFFEDTGTAFIVKSLISEAPSEIKFKTSDGRFEPFMAIW